MKSISRDDLKQMNETEHEDFVLINVLPRDAFNREHIRTSISVPVEEPSFLEQVEAVTGSKDRKLLSTARTSNVMLLPRLPRSWKMPALRKSTTMKAAPRTGLAGNVPLDWLQ